MSVSDTKVLLHSKLQNELIHRSASAAITFSASSLIFIFFHFDIQNDFLIFYNLLIMASSIIRLYMSVQVKKNKVTLNYAIKLINWSIVANALSWSLLFFVFISNLPVGSLNSFIVVLVIIVFTNASVITLGSNLKLALLFQNLLIIPPFISYFLNYQTTSDSSSLLMCIIFTVYSAYLASQTLAYHKQLKSKAMSEIDLEKSAELLNALNTKLLAQTVRSENASRLAALGQMAGGIAHEINNPLAIISMSVELAQEHLTSTNDNKENIKKNLRVALTAVTRIVEIIRSLKLISNNSQEAISEIALESILADSLNLSREKFKNANIQIHIENIPALKVNANSVQVSQVMMNLLNNSFDAVSETEMQNRFIKIYFTDKDNYINISIENSGKTIESKHLEKLFQPFFTTKEVGRGTGLGLSLCKSIIESLNGQIWHEHNKTNTTFTFSLPKSKSQSQVV